MKSILVVEDSKSIQALIEATLANAGYEVLTCDDGIQASTLLKKRDVDLIITDMHMPNMDGARLVNLLHNRNLATPILVATSDSSDKTKDDFKGKGVKGWLTKPIESIRLLTAVDALLN